MKRTVFLLALVPALACDNDKPTTVPTDAAAVAPGSDATASEPDVPQEPDPPQLAAAAKDYWLGHYGKTIETLTPVYADLTERKQYRASGLAAGWLALAHAQVVFEQSKGPAEYALRMAEQTGDAEVLATAKVAHGAFLLGGQDFAAAITAFEAAASAAPDSPAGALARLLLAEARIGAAYAAGETLENPELLDAAKSDYKAAAAAAAKGVETEVVMGRVEEGLAAIADYQRDKKAVCTHAASALTHFKKAGVAGDMMGVSEGLTKKFKCK